MTVVISFDHVTKSFSGGLTVLDGVTMTIRKGEFFALVGPSGCGKTTLMNIVNRLVEPTSGTISVGGLNVEDIPLTSLRRSMGYVVQNAGLFPHHNVARNITTIPRLNGVPAREAAADVPRLMALVGLDLGLATRYPAQLSGGQRQRVGLARALAHSPRLLLMDEPFGALDPVVRRHLQDTMLALHRELDMTTVIVTHDMDEAIRLSDRLALLGPGGKVLQCDTPQNVLLHPASQDVSRFIGQDERMTIRNQDGYDIVTDSQGRMRGVIS